MPCAFRAAFDEIEGSVWELMISGGILLGGQLFNQEGMDQGSGDVWYQMEVYRLFRFLQEIHKICELAEAE